MNNKGFTLIELMASLVLIALISITIGVGVTDMLDRQLETNYSNYKKQIEDAACTYVGLSTYNEACKTNRQTCTVSASTLITEGLIAEDLENPQTKEPINSSESVLVKWENNEKKCTYQSNS